MEVAHVGLHFGEEPYLTGTGGSGTVFFAHCNLRCVYCQNWQISQPEWPTCQKWRITPAELAKKMLDLQRSGAHNINLVSPSHYLPQIIQTLKQAEKMGLNIPIVYNTNGYETIETLNRLKEIVDIYLPDIKYADDKIATRYSAATDYVEISREAIREMFRQVGPLKINRKGIAQRGLIVRHLVLPNGLAGTKDCLLFLASVSKKITISLMAQYQPCFKAKDIPVLNRPITEKEYRQTVKIAKQIGFENILIQELSSREILNPDFQRKNPFTES